MTGFLRLSAADWLLVLLIGLVVFSLGGCGGGSSGTGVVTIEGQLKTSAGQPIAGATITEQHGNSTTTAADGSFSLLIFSDSLVNQKTL